jgi:aspartate/tyrosine/aromatic aminotransferase
LFELLERVNEDAILGLMAKFRADPSGHKVDLGAGVYRDIEGNTPVLECVRAAERAILAGQNTKSYVAAAGRAEFNHAITELVCGPLLQSIGPARLRTVQAPGGCGALRIGAELIRAAAPAAVVHVSDPTWANHVPLLGGSGLRLARYAYYDTARNRLRFEAMLESLDRAAAGDVVLLHACCHNPTGADLAPDQWRAVIEVLGRRRLIPFLDLAYQGFGGGLDADVEAVRLVAKAVPESLIAVSFSKNFGLYRERVGALITVSADAAAADAAYSHVLQIARSIYSMPPDHGAAITAHILADPALRASWLEELAAMRGRIEAMRGLLAAELRARVGDASFDFIGAQRGMFSLLGVPPAVVARLRERHHIYIMGDSRMNVAGVTPGNAAYVADAIVESLGWARAGQPLSGQALSGQALSGQALSGQAPSA